MAVQLPQSFLRADIEEFNQVPCRSDPYNNWNKDLFLDVKMNHVRGAVSIRNLAQGSDPSSIGDYDII